MDFPEVIGAVHEDIKGAGQGYTAGREGRHRPQSGRGRESFDPLSAQFADGHHEAASRLPESAEAGGKATTQEAEEVAVGDLNSDLPGTGARKNAGKTPLHLIPVSVLAYLWDSDLENNPRLGYLMEALSIWQEYDAEAIWVALDTMAEYTDSCARVFDYGQHKYAAWNWAKGMPWSVPLGCILRHTRAILDGEEIDQESGESHYGHIMCNLVMLLHYSWHYTEGDDRPGGYCFGRRPDVKAIVTDYDNYANMRAGQGYYTNGAIGE